MGIVSGEIQAGQRDKWGLIPMKKISQFPYYSDSIEKF